MMSLVFGSLVALALIVITKILYFRRYASELSGREENTISRIRAFLGNHPREGKVLVGFIVTELTIAVFLMVIVMWDLFARS